MTKMYLVWQLQDRQGPGTKYHSLPVVQLIFAWIEIVLLSPTAEMWTIQFLAKNKLDNLKMKLPI